MGIMSEQSPKSFPYPQPGQDQAEYLRKLYISLTERDSQQTRSTHPLVSATHTAAGLTNGHFLKATGATTFGFAAHGLSHSDLGSVTANQHHSQAHVLDGADHTVSGLTGGHFLKATAATTFAFGAHGLTYTDVGAAATSHTHANLTTTAKASAYCGSNYVPSASSWLEVTLDSEVYDPGNSFASNAFTAPVTGYYLCCGAVRVANASGAPRSISTGFAVDDALVVIPGRHTNLPNGDTLAETGSAIISVTSGQTIKLYFYIDDKTNVTVQGSASPITYLSVHLLSA